MSERNRFIGPGLRKPSGNTRTKHGSGWDAWADTLPVDRKRCATCANEHAVSECRQALAAFGERRATGKSVPPVTALLARLGELCGLKVSDAALRRHIRICEPDLYKRAYDR